MSYFNYKSLQYILDDVIKSYDLKEYHLLYLLTKEWNIITNNDTYNHSSVISFKEGVLKVKTKSSTWRYELGLRKDSIISNLNDKLNINILELIIH